MHYETSRVFLSVNAHSALIYNAKSLAYTEKRVTKSDLIQRKNNVKAVKLHNTV